MALDKFKKEYPDITSADLQTFIIGWGEAVKEYKSDIINSWDRKICKNCGRELKIECPKCDKDFD